MNSHDTPAEEFRTLRTRLNHLQTLQPLHTVVVTSPSPAEGKTFTAVNLALAQSHLAETSVLLADFDLRRPDHPQPAPSRSFSGAFGLSDGGVQFRAGITPHRGHEPVFPAGWFACEESPRTAEYAARRNRSSMNCRTPSTGRSSTRRRCSSRRTPTCWPRWRTARCWWSRSAATTFDNVTRAMQSLCENNVLGIVANGARASELYSKYTYYYSKAD